ncbi:MAG: hypothetical protein V7609_3006 [Verrucomicrobiota bacterium]
MTRSAIRQQLGARLAKCESILALWEGGSAAFGWADEYSDLDLALLYKLGARDQIWRVINQAFDELGGVALRWNDPKQFPSGGGKRIFRPKGADSWLQVDIGIIPESAKQLYNQPERHGRILIIFDRTGRLTPTAWDEEGNRQRACISLHQNLMRWHIHYGWFRKEVARGRPVDAFVMHYHMTIRPLMMILNLRYRPSRWDFGLRYLKEELPPEVVKVVERLCYVPDPSALEERFCEAEQLLRTTAKELEERGVIPIDPSGFDILPGLTDREVLV